MAYRRLSIEEIATLVGHWKGGESERKIARLTGIDRKTVRRYLAAAERAELTREAPLSEADVANLAKRVQSRSKAGSSPGGAALAVHEAQIGAWIAEDPPVGLREVHRRLVGQGVAVTYWTLRRFTLRMRASRQQRDATIPAAPDSGVQASERGLTADSTHHLGARGLTA